MNAATFLVLLIPLSLFLSYRQAVHWEKRDLLRSIESDPETKARRAMEATR